MVPPKSKPPSWPRIWNSPQCENPLPLEKHPRVRPPSPQGPPISHTKRLPHPARPRLRWLAPNAVFTRRHHQNRKTGVFIPAKKNHHKIEQIRSQQSYSHPPASQKEAQCSTTVETLAIAFSKLAPPSTSEPGSTPPPCSSFSKEKI